MKCAAPKRVRHIVFCWHWKSTLSYRMTLKCDVFPLALCWDLDYNTIKPNIFGGVIMKGVKTWSYQQYKPLCWYAGDIYICRIAPISRHAGFNTHFFKRHVSSEKRKNHRKRCRAAFCSLHLIYGSCFYFFYFHSMSHLCLLK